MKTKKATGDNILKELRDRELKIITALVNRICMFGDGPKNFQGVTIYCIKMSSKEMQPPQKN